MRRKTRRRKLKPRCPWGRFPYGSPAREACRKWWKRFERQLPKGQYPNFANLEAEANRRAETDMERKAFLRSGKKKPLPFGRNDDPEKMHGGRQYPKSRTHVYSRATPTHNIGRSKRSRSRRSKSRSKSRSRSKRRRRSRRRRKRTN